MQRLLPGSPMFTSPAVASTRRVPFDRMPRLFASAAPWGLALPLVVSTACVMRTQSPPLSLMASALASAARTCLSVYSKFEWQLRCCIRCLRRSLEIVRLSSGRSARRRFACRSLASRRRRRLRAEGVSSSPSAGSIAAGAAAAAGAAMTGVAAAAAAACRSSRRLDLFLALLLSLLRCLVLSLPCPTRARASASRAASSSRFWSRLAFCCALRSARCAWRSSVVSSLAGAAVVSSADVDCARLCGRERLRLRARARLRRWHRF